MAATTAAVVLGIDPEPIPTKPVAANVRIFPVTSDDFFATTDVRAELGGRDGPLAVTWRGLPASPPQLAASGAIAVHSVRSWKDWTESEIRSFFRDRRRTAQAD